MDELHFRVKGIQLPCKDITQKAEGKLGAITYCSFISAHFSLSKYVEFRPAVVLCWMVQHIFDFVCSAAPAIPSAVPQILQTYYRYKVVSALLQSVNVLLLSSYLSNRQSKPSGVGKGEYMSNSSAETEYLYPASCMLVVVSDLMQPNIWSTQDSVVVGLGLSAEFWSSFHRAHTPTLFLILSWSQCHTSTLSYIRLDFAPSRVLNPLAYHVSGGH